MNAKQSAVKKIKIKWIKQVKSFSHNNVHLLMRSSAPQEHINIYTLEPRENVLYKCTTQADTMLLQFTQFVNVSLMYMSRVCMFLCALLDRIITLLVLIKSLRFKRHSAGKRTDDLKSGNAVETKRDRERIKSRHSVLLWQLMVSKFSGPPPPPTDVRDSLPRHNLVCPTSRRDGSKKVQMKDFVLKCSTDVIL